MSPIFGAVTLPDTMAPFGHPSNRNKAPWIVDLPASAVTFIVRVSAVKAMVDRDAAWSASLIALSSAGILS